MLIEKFLSEINYIKKIDISVEVNNLWKEKRIGSLTWQL